MNFKKSNLVLAAILMLFGLNSFGMGDSPTKIKIGFNVPLTGFAAADGKSALNGAELAVAQANEAGGIDGKKIELVVYDDQASPKESVPIAQKLIQKDKVVIGISGSYSGSTRAAAGVFQENKTPYISAYAVHPGITKAGDYVFRTSFVGNDSCLVIKLPSLFIDTTVLNNIASLLLGVIFFVRFFDKSRIYFWV